MSLAPLNSPKLDQLIPKHELKERIYQELALRTCKIVWKVGERTVETSGCLIKNFLLDKVQVLSCFQDHDKDNDKIEVIYRSQHYSASLESTIDSAEFKKYDLCILNIEGNFEKTFKFKYPATEPKLGQKIYFSGASLGQEHPIIHQGYISSIQPTPENYHFLTIDGRIVQGQPGGPVIISEGHRLNLLGIINSAPGELGKTTMIGNLPHNMMSAFLKPSTSQQQLTSYQQHPFEGLKYLIDQLFSTENFKKLDVNYYAYLYVLPDGFMIVLSASEGFPTFNYSHTADGSEIARQACYSGRLKLSQEAHTKILELAKKVKVKNLNGTEEDKEWELVGVPSCICIEGKWNRSPNLSGTAVDWDNLILSQTPHQHIAFGLSIVPPTWQHITQTPDLRGVSFNHTHIHFNIWIHEKNINVLDSENQQSDHKIKTLKQEIQFIRDFEDTRFEFEFLNNRELPKDRGGKVNLKLLDKWCGLVDKVPFSHLKQQYSELPDLFQQYRKKSTPELKSGLLESLKNFLDSLPKEAYFGADFVCFEQFHKCSSEYYSSKKDLVRSNGFIDVNKLQEWLTMLKRVAHHFGSTQPDFQLSELIKLSQEYLDPNNRIRNAKKLLIDHDQYKIDTERRKELDPLLKKGYQSFFQKYEYQMANKGRFISDLQFEIKNLEKQQRRRDIFSFCEQDKRVSFIEDYLLRDNQEIDPEKLGDCLEVIKKLIECWNEQYSQLSQLIEISGKYIRKFNSNKVSHGQWAPLNLINQKKNIIQLLKDKYQHLFTTVIPSLKAEDKKRFLERLKKLLISIQDSEQKQRYQEIISFCEQDRRDSFIEKYLLGANGEIDPQKLDDCTDILNNLLALKLFPDIGEQLKAHMTEYQSIQDLLQEIDRLKADYQKLFTVDIPSLSPDKKKEMLDQLAKYMKIPRSHTSTTAQIAFSSKLDPSDLHLIMRRDYASQVNTLVDIVDSHLLDMKNDCDLSVEFYEKFKVFYGEITEFILRKAKNLEIVTDASWRCDSEEELGMQTVERLSDGSEYHFRECKSSRAREILYQIKEICSALSNQHTKVMQKNYPAYINSSFLEEEIKTLREFCLIINEFLFLVRAPLRWDHRTQGLRKNSLEIKKAKRALDEAKDMFIYKRIENSGNVSSDLLVNQQEASELSRHEETHTAIYSLI